MSFIIGERIVSCILDIDIVIDGYVEYLLLTSSDLETEEDPEEARGMIAARERAMQERSTGTKV